MRHVTWKNFFLLIILAFGIVASLEYILMRRHQSFQYEHRHFERTFRASATPGLIYEHIPGIEECNSQGFRDVEHAMEPAKEVRRVIVLGDSVAQGHSAPFEQRFVRLLQQRFDARCPQKTEFILVAETGYNTEQELILLKQTGLRYAPEFVLWTYCLNDPAHAVYRNENNLLAIHFFEPGSWSKHALFQLGFSLRERLRGLGQDKEYHRFLHTVYQDEVRANFAAMAELCAQAKARVLFLIIPVLDCATLAAHPDARFDAKTYPLADVHQDLTALAREHGFDVIDGAAVFNGETLASLMLNPTDAWHPSPHGHALLSDALSQALEPLLCP